jgi:hypothetical protein
MKPDRGDYWLPVLTVAYILSAFAMGLWLASHMG